MHNNIGLTYFEIAAALAEKEDDFYCIPQDIPKVAKTPGYENFIYSYISSGEYMTSDGSGKSLALRYGEVKNRAILFMLLCAAAEDEDFPFAF